MKDIFDLDNCHDDIMDTTYALFARCFQCGNRKEINVIKSFCAYLASLGVNQQTCLLYLAILGLNQYPLIAELCKGRKPFQLFSTVHPNPKIIRKCFQILTHFKPQELLREALMAILGLLDITYKNANIGFSTYSFSIYDLFNIAKYLDEELDQFYVVNRSILQLFDYFYAIQDNSNQKYRESVAYYAMKIRLVFLDKEKPLSMVVPEELLNGLENPENLLPFVSGKVGLTAYSVGPEYPVALQ